MHLVLGVEDEEVCDGPEFLGAFMPHLRLAPEKWRRQRITSDLTLAISDCAQILNNLYSISNFLFSKIFLSSLDMSATDLPSHPRYI